MQAYSKDGSQYQVFAQFKFVLEKMGKYNWSFQTIMVCSAEDRNCSDSKEMLTVVVLFGDGKTKQTKEQTVAQITIDTYEQNKWMETSNVIEIDEIEELKIEVSKIYNISLSKYVFITLFFMLLKGCCHDKSCRCRSRRDSLYWL